MGVFFKQKTAYEIASGDWSSDVCSSDLTTDELPHIRGDVLDFTRQDPNQKLTTHGVFSAPASIENVLSLIHI